MRRREALICLFLTSSAVKVICFNVNTNVNLVFTKEFYKFSPLSIPRNNCNVHQVSKGDDDSWDSDTDYPSFNPDDEKDGDEFPMDFSKGGLGIDIGKRMGPMSPEDIAELKAEATEAIDSTFASRLEEIEKLRQKMAEDFEKSKKAMDFASELNAQRESEKLMGKIDAISNKFLSENKELRMGTKLAAQADKLMEGKGLDVGSWGKDEGGNAVTTGILIGAASTVDTSMTNTDKKEGGDESSTANTTKESKIFAVIDDSQKMDKQLLDRFTALMQEYMLESSSIEIVSHPSSKPIPMGGLNSQTAIIFTSSLSDRRAVETILERVLTRTAPISGKMSSPPTHLVCITPLGTDRTNEMPYSMQNLFGGKLDKKKAMEEAVIGRVRRGTSSGKYPLDYTVFKIGNILDSSPKEKVSIMPGDSLDGDIGLEAAAQALVQAVAFQAAARNATLSVIGGNGVEKISQEEWDDSFIRLDGPELYRKDIPLKENSEEAIKYKYDRLKEYIKEWADTMFVKKTSGTGLTTPVIVEKSRNLPSGQTGIQILFKQTATGSAYKSKAEEQTRERQTAGNKVTGYGKKQQDIPMAKRKKEGGLEVIVEIRKALPAENGELKLRVRGRRCNMDNDTVVKEISEGVLVKTLKDAVKFWIDLPE